MKGSEALEGASFPVRMGVRLLYWPVVLTIESARLLALPFRFIHEVWDRLLRHLGYWDEALPPMLTACTSAVFGALSLGLLTIANDAGYLL